MPADRVASLFEAKTGVTHKVRNPSPQLWFIAVRRQKKKGAPDKARFSVWTRCGVYLRANSLVTTQSVTCIACLMQPEEPLYAVDTETHFWTTPLQRINPPRKLGWFWNTPNVQQMPFLPKEETMATTKQGVLDLNKLGDIWRTADGLDHYACNHQKNWNHPTMARCGESLGKAVNLTLLPNPVERPTVTCIACIAGDKR